MKTSALLLVMIVIVKAPAAEIPVQPAPGTNHVLITPAYLNALADTMRTNHPALNAAQSMIISARANVDAVRTWEDPMVQLGGMGARTDMRMEDGDLIYGVEQKLPLFGKPRLARTVAESELSTEKVSLEYRFQLLRRDLAKAVFRAGLADRVVAIGEQDLTWLDTFVTVVEQRYRAGQASQVDLLRVQNERAKRIDQLVTDKHLRAHEHLTLNRMLQRDLQARWPTFELPKLARPISFNQRLIDLALKHEPKAKVLRQQIRQAEATAEWTRRQRWPDLSVGLEGRNYSGDGSFRQGALMLSFNVPLGNAAKYRSDLRREKAKVDAAEHELQDYQQSVIEEIHHLTVRIDAARREGSLYENEILPRAELALTSVRAALESGRGMFLDLLEARRMLLEAQLMQAKAVAEQYEMLSELVLCCGLGDLEALLMLGIIEDAPDTKQ
jgi:outer membrane protein, heavy metal efflux system